MIPSDNDVLFQANLSKGRPKSLKDILDAHFEESECFFGQVNYLKQTYN